jgi:hypothetical protein
MSGGAWMLVVLDDALPVKLNEMAGPLARALRRVRYDVVAALKNSPYIPFIDLDRRTAEAGADYLTGAGIRAAAVSAGELPPPARIFTVHNLGLAQEGLKVQTDYAGKMSLLAWNGIEAFCLAVCSAVQSTGGLGGSIDAEEEVMQMHLVFGAAAGIVPNWPVERAPTQSRTEVFALMTLMPRGAEVEIRVRADQMNYECLGGKLTRDSRANFHSLVTEIAGRVSGGRINLWASEFVRTGTLPAALPKARVDAYNRWFRLRARLKL